MAQKRSPGTRDGLIHCENCGENYSDTYRRCPFCNSGGRQKTRREDEFEYDDYEEYEEYDDAYETTRSLRGGKRLAPSEPPSRGQGGPRISPFQIISIAVSLIVILTAIWIVVTKLVPMIRRGEVDTVDPNGVSDVSPDPNASSSPEASPAPGVLPTQNLPAIPGASLAPEASLPPETSPTPNTAPLPDTPTTQPTANTQPASSGPTDFSLNKNDVTLQKKGEVWKPVVTFSPAGTSASLTWTSDNTNVVTVSSGGTVTAVGTGTTTITAMLPNGATHSCIVRCNWTEATPTPTAAPTSTNSSASYSINNPDFTFDHVGEPFQLKVNGYTGVVSWSSSNSGVATVGSDGTCTAVANGTCTVTGTLNDGSTVEAIVRVNIQN